jgi:hypothetical protein
MGAAKFKNRALAIVLVEAEPLLRATKQTTSASNRSACKAEKDGQGQKNRAISGRFRLYHYA